jgi:putative nucleotidyltransferase with HDIG domain
MHQVLSHINEMSSSAASLQAIVEQDPSLTSLILKVANSSFYSPVQEISNVSRAISMMGFMELRNLVISHSLTGLFSEDLGFAELKAKDLWLHAIGVATAGKKIAYEIKGLEPEDMFAAGILHDIGRIIYCLHLKDELYDVLALAKESGISLNAAEEEYGLTHAEVGGYLATRWKLSSVLIDAIQYHHNPEAAGKHAKAAAVICLADALAIKAEIGMSGFAGKDKAQLPSTLGLAPETIEGIALQLLQEKEKLVADWSDVIGEG